jgi:hypothetical protein
VVEVLTWVSVEPVYLLQAGLMAWEYRVGRAGLVYLPRVHRPPWAYPSVEQTG